MKNNILLELKDFEKEFDIDILYAVESGSRAWGFASKDSDYDIRFIYKHRPEWYLRIGKTKDSIESLNKLLDFAGWDIRKTLRLFHKMNPPLMEWLNSPIIYLEKTKFAQDLRNLLKQYFSSKPMIYHYMHMAVGNYDRYIKSKSKVKLKKYLYVLRPILCCLWIEENRSMPPTEFDKILKHSNISFDLSKEITLLMEEKRDGKELLLGSPRLILNRFIEEQIQHFDKISGRFDVVKIDSNVLDQILVKYIFDSRSDSGSY